MNSDIIVISRIVQKILAWETVNKFIKQQCETTNEMTWAGKRLAR